MKLVIRLYRRHDLDLLYLYQNPDFNFQKKIKTVLKDFIKNEGNNPRKTIVHIPPYSTHTCNYTDLRSCVQIHIYLSEKKDKDIIEFIKNIKTGFRNSLVKNIFRNYLDRPAVYNTLSCKMENNSNTNKNSKEIFKDIINAP